MIACELRRKILPFFSGAHFRIFAPGRQVVTLRPCPSNAPFWHVCKTEHAVDVFIITDVEKSFCEGLCVKYTIGLMRAMVIENGEEPFEFDVTMARNNAVCFHHALPS